MEICFLNLTNGIRTTPKQRRLITPGGLLKTTVVPALLSATLLLAACNVGDEVY